MAHVVRLRRTEFETQAAALGLQSQSAQARALGLHVAIHNKVLTGKTKELSGAYVVAVLLLLGSDCVTKALQQFFDIELDERETVAS